MRKFFHDCELFRFVCVGFFNTLLSFLMYASVLSIGFNHWIANLCALLLGIAVGFWGSGFLVFKNFKFKFVFKFVFVWLFIYLIIGFLISHFQNLGLNAYAAGFVALPFSAIMSYVLQKYIVFSSN